MELMKAIEELNWKKEELKNLDRWLSEVELHNQPVNGIHWRKLKSLINGFADELQAEIVVMEVKIKEVADGIEVDI